MAGKWIFIVLLAVLRVRGFDLMDFTLVNAYRRLSAMNLDFSKIDITPGCYSAALQVFDELENPNGTKLWALQMLDSSTKIPNGILTGNLMDYGSYDECLAVKSDDGRIFGKHCLVNFNLGDTDWLNAIAPGLNSSSLNPVIGFKWSYCVPDSCEEADLITAFRGLIDANSLPVNVTSAACHTTTSSEPLSPVDIFGITLCGIFLALTISSTVYDVIASSHKCVKNPWLVSFSLYTNGERLFSVKTGAETMAPLNGLRFLSIAWIIFGHRHFFGIMVALMNSLEIPKTWDAVEYQLTAGAVLAVDTFFLLSGLLNAFHLLKLLDKTHRFPGIIFFVHRYIRTTPALAAVVLIYATWYVRLGDGPAWDSMNGYQKTLCLDNWWPTLLYINNYYNPVEECAGQSWYLAVDMQLYWLSPLVIVPIWKYPILKNYYLGFLLLLSTISQFVIAYVYEIRMPFTVSQDLEDYKKVTRLMYVPTHTRATPYIIGIMLGSYLNHLRKKKHQPIFSKLLVTAGWLLSAGLCLSVILGNYQFFRSEVAHPYNQIESSFYIGLHRIAWSAGIAWIIVACLFGYGGLVNSILSWKAFVPLSRLTYCIFLCHMAVQQYQLGVVRTTDYYQEFNQIHRYFGDLAMAVLASAVLCLMFESPVTVLEKLVFNRPQARTKDSESGIENRGFESER